METTRAILAAAAEVFARIDALPADERMDCVNAIREELHEHSPMRGEPVDCVVWIPADQVVANDYNPNTVAPPEMRLLELSIEADGFTQPIVTCRETSLDEVVDGFHRNRVGKERPAVRERLHGRLPVARIKGSRADRPDRIASTIRHNRARGKHGVDEMSKIVLELARRNWNNAKIGRELGMDEDEVLRLKQITGLAELFADHEFSEAWEVAQ